MATRSRGHDAQPVVYDQFNGLYRAGLAADCPPDMSPACENVDLTNGTARPRQSLAGTNMFSGLTSAIDHLNELDRQDGVKELIAWQGGGLWAKENPAVAGATPASATQIDAALTTTSYPIEWRTPITTDTKAWMAQLARRMLMVNGQDAPLIYDHFGLDKAGIYQPRSFRQGLLAPLTNQVWQGGGNYPDVLFEGWEHLWAFTWYDKKRDVESNPSPIVQFGSTGLFPAAGVGYVGQVQVQIDTTAKSAGGDRPPRATHIRIYVTRTGDEVLKRIAEVEITGATTIWAATGTNPAHVRHYSDAALLRAPVLEEDHAPPPALAAVVAQGDYIFGAPRWKETYLPGRAGIRGTPATATTAGGGSPGYVVVINPSGTSGRIQEHHVGMTIRFPGGANEPYLIRDVIEGTQQILIGANIGEDVAFSAEGGLATADQALIAQPFILEDVGGRFMWCNASEPDYWFEGNYARAGEDDGEFIKSFAALNGSIGMWKGRSFWRHDYTDDPIDGKTWLISDNIGIDHPHGVCVRGSEARFTFAGLEYATNGGEPFPVSDLALGEGGVSTNTYESVHMPNLRITIHFAGTEGLVHWYDRGKKGYMPWTWLRGYNANSGSYENRIITAAHYGPDSDGVLGLWMGDDRGRIWRMYDGVNAAGAADGHAIAQDLNFRAKSTTTSVGTANGEIVDSRQAFPDHAAIGASVIDNGVKVRTPSGQILRGYITTRTSATVVQTTISTIIPQGSIYEVGYIHWYYQTGFRRVGTAAHDEDGAKFWYQPKAINTDEYRARKLIYAQTWLLGATGPSQLFSPVAFDQFPDEADFSLVDTAGGPDVTFDPVEDKWLFNYMTGVYPASLGRPRENENPGVQHIECGVTSDLGQLTTMVATRFGEEGVAIKGEVISVTIPMTFAEEEYG